MDRGFCSRRRGEFCATSILQGNLGLVAIPAIGKPGSFVSPIQWRGIGRLASTMERGFCSRRRGEFCATSILQGNLGLVAIAAIGKPDSFVSPIQWRGIGRLASNMDRGFCSWRRGVAESFVRLRSGRSICVSASGKSGFFCPALVSALPTRLACRSVSSCSERIKCIDWFASTKTQTNYFFCFSHVVSKFDLSDATCLTFFQKKPSTP